ncbi:MAG: hypothetical protein ACOXZ0_08210 [Eubacteriales bacterium]|jgi:chaperonin cofactor prefoldin
MSAKIPWKEKKSEDRELNKNVDDLEKRVKTLEKNYKNLLDKLNERK